MKKQDTLVVALYAGPGTGKSSSMAGIFSELKWLGVNCEMAPEFAKEKVWEKSLAILSNQIYVFGKQLHTLVRVMGQVDVVITDSPLLLSLIYGHRECKEFHDLVLAVNNRYRMMNVFLRRHKKYNPAGRLQTEEEARTIDGKILDMLQSNDIPFTTVDSGRNAVQEIVQMVLSELGSKASA